MSGFLNAITADQRAQLNAAASIYPQGLPQNLKRTRKTIANVRAGLANGRIGFLGDSTTAGSGGAQATRNRAMPIFLRDILKGQGVNARYASIFGSSDKVITTTSAYSTYNTEVAFTSGWGLGSLTVGGQAFTNSTTTSALTWTPSEQINTFEFYYAQSSGQATFNVAIDGGAPTTINADGTISVQKATITAGSVGTHTLSFARTGVGGAFSLLGAIAYDSTKPGVDLINIGWGSSTTSDWIDNSTYIRASSVLPQLSLDTVIINLGINDRTPVNGPIPLVTYEANLRALITTAQAGASRDVILMVPVPSDASRQTLALQQQYDDVVRKIGADTNLAVIDIPARWENWVSANALGFMNDIVHPLPIGYADEAAAVAGLLLR